MNREQHLAFCKKCLNQKMDLNQGIVCSLTQRQADFINECSDFKLDETIVETNYEDAEEIPREDMLEKLNPEVIETLRDEQDFQSAVIVGIITGLVGALLWAAITVSTEYQIGYMAVAIGFGVGYMIRKFGKGIDPIFGYLGATIALLSCLLGNIFGIVGFVANAEGLGYIETLLGLDYSLLPSVMAESFSVIDLLFYGFAVFEGYKYSFRKITEEDLEVLNSAR